MAVLPPLTDDFVINGGFAAMTLFSIILTIYLIRYRAKLDRAESRIEPDAVLWMKDNLMRLSSSEENPAGFTVRKLRYWDLRKRGGARLCSLFVPAARQQKGRPGVLGQLCLVLMLAAAGVMCGTRGSALAQTGTAWSSSDSLPNAAGTYYLTTDITSITSYDIWTVPSGGVTLDLNGYNVTGFRFAINSGVTLTVKDSKNSGEITFETWPIEVNGGSFHFEGGTLTTSTDSAIVRVQNNGSFSMSGGTITGGWRGVALHNQDSFTMTGGKIIKCSIGVDIWEGSTAEISGGEISGHRSYGIHAVSGTVTMNGGVIKGNQNGIGIGERNNSGTLNLSGGTITENTQYGIRYSNGKLNLSDAPAAGAPHPTVTGNGSNVYIANAVNDLRINVNGSLSQSTKIGISMAKPGVFTNGLNNRGTTANFSSDDSSYAVRLTPAGEAELGKAVASITSGGVTNRYTRLQDAMDAAQPNDTILLLDNISASTDTFPILAWQEDITLDLNGKTISGKPASPSGDLIQIYRKNVGGENSYGRLTLKDTAGSGEIICEAGGCENVINIRGGDPNVLTMYGGKISGGATNVRVNGNFTMHGGEISGGTTNVNSLGQFTMSGGKISGGTTGVICHTLCSMSGGEISGASGNGVTLDDTSVFNLLGGTISGNGQYAIEAFENSFVFISNGNPIIVSRGSAESSRGIYLHEGSGISIYETPAAGSSIGVTLESGAGVAARGSRSKAPTEDDLAVFSSDEGYAKFLNTTKKAIVFGYQISYDAGGAEGDLPDAFVLDPTDTTADPKVPDRGSLTKRGYSFTGWKDEKGNEYAADADFKTLLAQYKPAGSVILTAQWEVNTYAVMLETYGGTINSGDVTQYTYGIGAALPTDVTRENYIFSGWYDNVEFSGDLVEQISASDTGEKTFYAQWKYTVRFDKNAADAQGTMADQSFIYNGAEQALRKNSFTREGYVFSGWNTVQDPKTQSGGAWYLDEMSVRNLPGDGIVTLYAQWEPTTVRIRKVDEDGYEIGGAVVSIFETLSGKPFGTEQTYDPARGDVIFEGLSIGVKYTVHEVKAPRGYSLAEDKTFVLDEYGFIDLFSADTTVKLIDGIIFLENEPTKVYVRKTDSQSGARLADAQLQLLNTQDGTVSWTSSGTDDREFSGLATGEEYTLHEAAAPSASYNAADDAVFVLDADGSIDPDLTTADYTMEGNNIILLVENVRLYTITFVNEDDSVLESEKWAYGSTPHYTGTLPEKPADVSHSYTFAGWSPHVTTVTGDATYKATYTSALNNYTVTFVDEDGTELQTASYAYGTPAADIALPADPTKTSTAQYDYRFAGWTPDIAAVTGNAEYRASYTPVLRQYTVTFVNEDNSVLESGTWDYGATPHYTGTLPEKPADVSHSYTFAGWDPAVTTVTGDATYKAKYDQTVNTYLVTFVDEDGTELQSDRYAYGTPAADIAQPANPTKDSDAQYTYSFAGWTPAIAEVTGDATYRATYNAVLRQYTVTFLDDDGTELGRDLYPYGTLAADIVRPQDPEKTSDAQYTYNFAGWTPTFANVTGNAVYRASYDAVLRQYTVTFVNEDNTELQSGLWDYGATPVYHGEVPTKPADVSHTYHFAGWDPEIVTVTGDATYTAAYSQTENLYTVTFVDEDGTVLKEAVEYPYGTKAADIAEPDDPVKTSTAQYDYTFAGWTPAITDVTGDVTYRASYNAVLRQYTVRFVNEDNTELQSGLWDYGVMPVYHGEVPTKPADVSHSYHFAGWDPEIVTVTGDAVYTAVYSQTENLYKITFVDEDGTVLKETEEYPYGTKAADIAEPDDPVKASTLKDDYTFAGWTPDIADVTGDATYRATYTAVLRQYTVRFINDDGTTLQSGLWNYGVTPVYHGEVPTKRADVSHSYHFAGWSPAITPVTRNTVYTAAYSQTENLYTVTFVDEDGTILKEATQYPYGTKAADIAEPEDPIKPSTAQYDYTFAGWDPAIADVTEDAVYTAAYTAVLRQYTITFLNEDNTVLQSGLWDYGATPVYHGITPAKPADVSHTYHFAGWDPAITAVTGDATYTAAYSQTENLYTVTFVDEDGTVLKAAEEYPYGTLAADIVKPDDPVKASTLKDDYIFAGWSPDISDVTEDVTYTAAYTAVLRHYTVRFVNIDGSTLQSGLWNYGATPVYHGEVPTKPADASHSYHFTGWNPAITAVTGDATYTAAYSQTENLYTVTFVDEDGTVLKAAAQYPYGTKAVNIAKPDDPVKPSTAQYEYTFTGWDPAIADVTADAVYTAAYSAALRRYTITFVNEDNTVLQSGLLDYGAMPVYHGEVPAKPADVSHSYHFAGWDPAITAVTGDAVYTAVYSQTENLYTVTFVDEDGTVLKEAVEYPYGTKAADIAEPDDPVKASTAQYDYIFAGWTPDIADVTENATYTAAYTAVLRQYTVRFVNEDNTELESVLWDYGETPIYTGETPVKTGEPGVVYTFIGWNDGTTDYGLSDPLPAVTGDVTYTARFTSEMLTFTVTWLNWNSDVLETDENVPYGTIPNYGGETPKREDAEGLVYTFAGWTDGIMDYGPSVPLPAVIADVTYTARFTSETSIYHVTVTSDENGTAYAVPTEGPTGTEVTLFATPNANCQFVRWQVVKGGVVVDDNKFVILYSDVEVKAVFEEVKDPFDMNVTVNNIMNDGSKGAPMDINRTHLDPAIILKGSENETSGKIDDGITVRPGTKQIKTTAAFANKVPEISGARYEVLLEGLPKYVSSAGKSDNKYRLTYNAWINDKRSEITINLIWTDRTWKPDEQYAVPLPEDEIGAYKIDPFGNKEYLLFHTYDICMSWLGNETLCSGYERCFHKEVPYIYDGNKIGWRNK